MSTNKAEERGFVMVAPGGHRFQFENGEPFFPTGFCHTSLDRLSESSFAAAREAGATLVRVWPDYAETGTFDETLLDRLFAYADEYDFYVLFSVVNPSRLSDLFADESEFDDGLTVYNKTCRRPEEVYTLPEARETTRRRLRRLIDRYAGNPRVFGYEIVNQGDAIYTSTAERLGRWLEETAGFAREYETERWGRAHLRCASSYDPIPAADVYYKSNELDFFAAHCYTRAVYECLDPVGAALEQHRIIRHVTSRLVDDRPYLDTEYGPISHFFDPALPEVDPDTYVEWSHDLSWSHFASGGAGQGLPIPAARPDEPLRPGQVNRSAGLHIWPECARSSRALKAFAGMVQWDRFVRRPADRLVSVSDPRVYCIASGSPEQVVAWLVRDTRARDVARLVEHALRSGPTCDANRSLRIAAWDSLYRFLRQRGHDFQSQYTRKAVSVLMRRGASVHAYNRVDEAMQKIRRLVEDPLVQVELRGWDASGPVRIALNLDAGSYQLRWVDDSTGEALREEIVRGPRATVESPPFHRHIALLLQRK